MSAAENTAVVHRYMDAFLSGDFYTAQNLLTDDVRLNVPGKNPLSGTHHGKQEVIQFLQQMRHLTGESLAFKICDVLANSRHVIVLFSPSARRVSKDWESRAVSVYRLLNGAIEEITVYQFDLYAFDAFMS